MDAAGDLQRGRMLERAIVNMELQLGAVAAARRGLAGGDQEGALLGALLAAQGGATAGKGGSAAGQRRAKCGGEQSTQRGTGPATSKPDPVRICHARTDRRRQSGSLAMAKRRRAKECYSWLCGTAGAFRMNAWTTCSEARTDASQVYTQRLARGTGSADSSSAGVTNRGSRGSGTANESSLEQRLLTRTKRQE